MVVSIIVAVALLGVLIWLFTQQEGLRKTAEDAQRTRERLASAADESTAKQMFPEAGGGAGKTLLGEMNKGVQVLCERIGGSQSEPPKVVLEKLDAAVKSITEAGKVPNSDQLNSASGAAAIIDTLHQLYVKEKEASQKAETDLAKALTDLDATSKANAELDQKFQGELAKLKTSVETLQNAKSEFEKTKTGEIDALKEQVSAKQDQLDASRRDQSKLMDRVRSELGERDKLLAEQRDALKDLRGPGALGAQELALAKKAVGSVLRALPGDSLVHIDLGRRDNVTLGMTFSVYSAEEQIPSDGRGKANIEVVSVGERTAECKVTTPPSPDDPILDGDKIGNIILSRNKAKKPQFVIVGGFDIDYDGTVDARGRETIVALVKRYGGEVAGTVTPATDYVVVGTEADGGAAAVEAERPAIEAEAAKSKEEPAKVEKEAGEEAGAGKEDKATAEEGSEEEPADGADEGADEETGDEAAAEPEEDEEEAMPAKADEGKQAKEKETTAAAEDEEGGEEKADAGEKAPGAVPQIPRAKEVDPTAGTSQRRIMSEKDRYSEAIRRAEMFSIPRLPQDRFLNFVGIEPGPGAAKRLQQ
jgi:hypothetical protein